jgi:TonB-linked SusC/RagA family outer membrane protein
MKKSQLLASWICGLFIVTGACPLSAHAGFNGSPKHKEKLPHHLINSGKTGNPLYEVTVTGTISNEKGEPLTGASIALKEGGASATANDKGAFTLTVPDGNVTLVITYIGYRTQEIKLNNRSTLSIVLTGDSKELENVVVIGYGTRKRSDVTGAIASVSSEQIRQVPVTNVSQALQGRIPGLVATQSSFRPGSGSTIRIRGNRSLQATNNPLYVVDGIPLAPENTIDDINPLDIETIDVLKDASATAIYGSRGANGVIQITTRKGKAGKVTVDYSGSTSLDKILVPLEVFNGPEWAQLKRDGFIASKSYNSNLSTANTSQLYFPDPVADFQLFRSRGDIYTWRSVANGYTWINQDALIAAKRATTAEEKTFLANLKLAPLDSVAIYDPSKVPSYDWQDQALRTGITQNHNISLTGGTDRFRTSFSGGYFNQKGIEFGQDYTRYTFTLNTDFKPNKAINVGGGLNYSNAIQNVGPSVYGVASSQLPIARPYDSTGKIIFFPGNDGNIINPLNDPNTIFNEIRINRLLGNVFADINLYKGLKFRSAFGIDLRNDRQGTFNGSQSSARAGSPANASYTTRNRFNWTLQNMLTYDVRIASKHAISALVAQELVKNRFENNTMSAESLNFESQKWYSLQQNSTGTVIGSGGFSQYQLSSLLGRLNYTFDDKYLVTFSLRNDNSSVLSDGHKGEFFPSGALAWRLDKESFMQTVTFVDQLKLRVGYGEVGNAAIAPYLTAGNLDRSLYNWGGAAATGYFPSTLPLPELTWEKTKTKNIALDFALLKNRITGTLDFYESNTNPIQGRSIPSASGYSTVLVNLGNVRNKGVELSLSTINIDRPNGLRWTTDFVVSYNKEAITNIDGSGADNIGNQWFLGQPTQIYYDWQFKGIFQYSDTAKGGILADYFWKKTGNKANVNFQPGRAYVADRNGDTVITDADKLVLGHHNPSWTTSFSSNFSYKGFDLGIYMYAQFGSMIRDLRPSLNARYQSNKVNYWTPTNPSNEYAQANNTVDIQQYFQAMSFRSGDFIRVRSISLAYHVPKSVINLAKLNSMTISFNVVNPFIFSKFKTADVETVPYKSSYPTSDNSGPTVNSYSYRSFVFGLRLGL